MNRWPWIDCSPARVSKTLLRLTEGAGTLPIAAVLLLLCSSRAGCAQQRLPPLVLAAGVVHPLDTITLLVNNAILSGRGVSSAGGAPVAGATVTATGSSGQAARPPSAEHADPAPRSGPTFTTTTDASGNFSLEIAPGIYSVTIAAAGFGRRSIWPVKLEPGALHGVGTLALDPTGAVTGTVVQEAGGSPIQGATVAVQGTLNQTTTDASGAFSLTQSAGTFGLQVSAPGFLRTSTEPFTLAPGTTLSVGAIQLGRERAVYLTGLGSGTLGSACDLSAIATWKSDGQTHPLQNVTVTFLAKSGPNAGKSGTATTDWLGSATFVYTSSILGTDTWQASIADGAGGVAKSNFSVIEWQQPIDSARAPTCQASLPPSLASSSSVAGREDSSLHR